MVANNTQNLQHRWSTVYKRLLSHHERSGVKLSSSCHLSTVTKSAEVDVKDTNHFKLSCTKRITSKERLQVTRVHNRTYYFESVSVFASTKLSFWSSWMVHSKLRKYSVGHHTHFQWSPSCWYNGGGLDLDGNSDDEVAGEKMLPASSNNTTAHWNSIHLHTTHTHRCTGGTSSTLCRGEITNFCDLGHGQSSSGAEI